MFILNYKSFITFFAALLGRHCSAVSEEGECRSLILFLIFMLTLTAIMFLLLVIPVVYTVGFGPKLFKVFNISYNLKLLEVFFSL